jgi:hypothetical protein
MTVASCDCGKGRCWNGNSCVFLKDYKKIFDQEQAEEQKILDAAKEKRKDAMLQNQVEVMKNIIAKKDAMKAAQAGAEKAKDTIVTNVSNNVNTITSGAIANASSNASKKPVAREPIVLMPAPDQKANNTTPLFAQTEQSKQKAGSTPNNLPDFPTIQVPTQ